MKKIKDIFAEVVSRVLDPVWEIPLSLLIAIGFAVQEGLRWRFLGLLLFIDVVVPMIFFFTMLYHRQIKDWDIQSRVQRIPLYLFTMVCHLGGLWLAHEVGKSELAVILAIFYVIGIIYVLITLRWKISIHAGTNAVLITSINMFYDWKYWYLYSLLGLVMWARVYQRHHSWAQVVAGAALGGGLVGVGFSIL